MVVHRYRKLLLRFVLPDYISIEKRLNLRRPWQTPVNRAGLLALLVFQNLLADAHALIANVGARILIRLSLIHI